MASTGDKANNLRKLQKELKLIRYPEDLNLAGLSLGQPQALLPIYHYALTQYSHAVAKLISSSNTELFGKTDFRFMEAAYKIFRDIFNYKPPMTKEQFFANGFAERKIIMCTDILQMIRQKHECLQPYKKSTTSGTAVSGLSHLKTSRPKSSDFQRTASSKLVPRERISSTSENAHTEGEAQIVNELFQPQKMMQEGPMPRHISSKHASREDILPPKVSLPLHTQAFKSSTIMFKGRHQDQQRMSTPAECIPRGLQDSSQHAFVDHKFSISDIQSSDIEQDEPLEIKALTRGESFMTSPDDMNEEGYNSQLQAQVTALQQSLFNVTNQVTNLDTVIKDIGSLLHKQNETPSPDSKITAVLISLQQQMESLMARMVLVENRVAMVESKVMDLPKSSSANFQPLERISRATSNFQQNIASSQNTTKSGAGFNNNSFIHERLTSHPLSEKSVKEVGQKEKNLENNVKLQESLPSTIKQKTPPNSSAYCRSVESVQEAESAECLSPIRRPVDMSAISMTIPFDTTGVDDTFAMSAAQDENRRSSTPTGGKVMTQCNDSLSFLFEDADTQAKVNKIKELFRSTEGLLK